MDYFDYATGLTMVNEAKWEQLFGVPRADSRNRRSRRSTWTWRSPSSRSPRRSCCAWRARRRQLTGSKYLVLAGGVALNCVANGKILKAGIFDDIWIQPAAGDAGGALGAAYAVWHIRERPRTRRSPDAAMPCTGSYLGPEFSDTDDRAHRRRYDAVRRAHYDDFCATGRATSPPSWPTGKVVGWFQGRMEFGPRALGSRSILGDPRNPEMQKKLNLKIKYREGFRPFAPSVLEEDVRDYFELDGRRPTCCWSRRSARTSSMPLPRTTTTMPLYERLYFLRSDLPAITHVDYSARIQTREPRRPTRATGS